jgi:cytochrome b561
MQSRSNPGHAPRFPRYPRLSIALHWLSALAVLLAFAVGWSRELFDEDAPRALLMAVHQGAGVLVLGLLLVRIGARLALPVAPPAQPLPRALHKAAVLGHAALYLLLLAMPLLGWALSNAHGHAVSVFGLFPLPTLVATDPDLGDTLEDWHKGLAWVFAATIVSHVAAALWHHFFRRDHVLVSMWPRATARFPISRSFR